MATPQKLPKDRRAGQPDRRSGRRLPGGTMDDRKTRFTAGYFFIAFVVFLLVQNLLGRQGTQQIPYSELKAHVANGDVQLVRIGEQLVEGVPTDTIQVQNDVRLWRAVR